MSRLEEGAADMYSKLVDIEQQMQVLHNMITAGYSKHTLRS